MAKLVYNDDKTSYNSYDDKGNWKGGGLAGTENWASNPSSANMGDITPAAMATLGKSSGGSSGGSSGSSSNNQSNNYSSDMRNALAQQQPAMEKMYNQQAEAQAAKIRQAIASQTQQAEATKADYTNQMNTSIGTLNTERAKIPGQVETANNTASSRGMVNAQSIRNSLAQMGLLQSGESASQQLLNDTSVSNNINANTMQGREIDTQLGSRIASSQAELASKIKAINDAISVARASGDENALMALTQAQNQIALSAANNNATMNNFQYQLGQDATANNRWNQTFEQQKAQDAFNNGIAEGNLTGYYGGTYYKNGVPQTGGGTATLPSSIAKLYPNATNVVEMSNGYSFTSANGVKTYYSK